jgi:hypothetical protein
MRNAHGIVRGGLVALVALTAACNAVLGVEDVTPLPDATSPPDAQSCDVAPDISLVTSNPSTSTLTHHASDSGVDLAIRLNVDAMPDAMDMGLYDSMGGHGIVNAVGTYSLTAADSKFETCGICITVFTNFDASSSTFSQAYMASAQGSLTLTRADTTGMTGRLQGLKLRQIDQASLMSGTTKDASGGCTVTIEDVEFTMSYSAVAAPATAVLRAIRPPR